MEEYTAAPFFAHKDRKIRKTDKHPYNNSSILLILSTVVQVQLLVAEESYYSPQSHKEPTRTANTSSIQGNHAESTQKAAGLDAATIILLYCSTANSPRENSIQLRVVSILTVLVSCRFSHEGARRGLFFWILNFLLLQILLYRIW